MIIPGSFKLFIQKNHKALFFFTWFLLGLMQAGMTELFDDEAYYWVYSRFPAWGYFDHPPMTAILIRAGYFLFKNELGVRLLIVTCSTATLYIIEKLLAQKNDRLFYAIACCMAIFQIGGIIAVPDIPLMFFAALFFLVYRSFIQKMNLRNTLLLGIVIALMMYSKYHGILVILFTLLSYPRLFIKYQTYLAALIALLLFAPHLYWQYSHGFPSVQYHLFERSAPYYYTSYTTDYILGQLLLCGPIAGFILLWAAFVYRPKDHLERALKYSMAGLYIFFLFSTFKGRVEANWTITAFIGLVVLAHQYLHGNEKLGKWIYRIAPITLILVCAVRVYMILDIAPSAFVRKDEFHGNRAWAASIQQKAQNLPVVFANSYQKPSKYWFYSGHPAFALNNVYYRRNNYNFWPIEDSLLGKKVYGVSTYGGSFIMSIIHSPGADSLKDRKLYRLSGYDSSFLADKIPTPKGDEGGIVIPYYASFSKINILVGRSLSVQNGTVAQTNLKIIVDSFYRKNLFIPPFDAAQIQLWVFREDNVVAIFNTGITLNKLTLPENNLACSFPVDLPPGNYIARYAIPSSIPGMPSLNSTAIKLAVK